MIALTHSSNRYQNIYRALVLIKDQLQKQIQGKKSIIIKVNFVSTINQLSATHPQAVKACVDFLLANFPALKKQKIIIAEGAAVGGTDRGWSNYGYTTIFKKYENIELFDLHQDQTVPVKIYKRNLKLKKEKIYKTIKDADFLISITPPKTHDAVTVTLGIKNIAVGALKPSHKVLTDKIKRIFGGKFYRFSLHQGYQAINLSLARLAKTIHPHLNIIDGFYGMQGNGPTHGDPVDWKITLAGLDCLEVDYFTAYLMGFDPQEIGYLYYLKKAWNPKLVINKIKIVGQTNWQNLQKKFKPHTKYKKQSAWKIKDCKKFL